MPRWQTASRFSARFAECIRGLTRSMGERDGDFSAPPFPGGHVVLWRLTRPSLPPVLFLAVGLWLSLLVGIELLFGKERDACLLCMLFSLAPAALSAVLLFCRRNVLGCLLLGIALGALCSGVHAATLLEQEQIAGKSEQAVELSIVRDARPGEFGSSALARTPANALVRLYLPDDCGLRVGDAIRADASWKSPSARSAQKSWRDGVVATARIASFEQVEQQGPVSWLRALRKRALEVLDQACLQAQAITGIDLGDARLLLGAVLLGSVDGLYTSGLYQNVKICGLAHLVAVSGAHLVIVCGFVMALFRRAALARPVAVLLQVMVILGYLVLTGAPISAVRAAIMASLSLLSFFSKRRPYALGGLAACMCAMLLLDPACAYSASFTLSVLATLGIVLFVPFIGAWLAGERATRRGAVVESLALTLAATLLTLPYCASQFGQVSLISPVANLIVTPLFSLVCVGGFAALLLGAIVAPVGLLAAAPVLVLSQVVCLLAGALSGVPHAAIPTDMPDGAALALTLAIPLVLWVLWPRPSARNRVALAGLLALGVLAGMLWQPDAGDDIVMLDVGQGDAILLRSGKATVLVDTGTQDIELLEGLARCGVRHLDAVLVSHPDDDHCGSLTALRGVVGVDRVLVARDLLSDGSENCRKLLGRARSLVGEQGVVGLAAGDTVTCGKLSLLVVGPSRFRDGGGNADSLVLLMQADIDGDGKSDHSALFCGDAESEELRAYGRSAGLGGVEIYKVGHHGSRNAIEQDTAQMLHPRVSLVSVGEYNRYGHPVASTLEQLEAVGSAIYRTDTQGSITCRLHPDSLEVSTER